MFCETLILAILFLENEIFRKNENEWNSPYFLLYIYKKKILRVKKKKRFFNFYTKTK